MLVGEVPGNLKHDWPKVWRRYVQRMFDHVDAFVTTTFATKEVYLRSLPLLRDRRFEVIRAGIPRSGTAAPGCRQLRGAYDPRL